MSGGEGKAKEGVGAEAGAGEVYCICRTADGSGTMLECDFCEDWFHVRVLMRGEGVGKEDTTRTRGVGGLSQALHSSIGVEELSGFYFIGRALCCVLWRLFLSAGILYYFVYVFFMLYPVLCGVCVHYVCDFVCVSFCSVSRLRMSLKPLCTLRTEACVRCFLLSPSVRLNPYPTPLRPNAYLPPPLPPPVP